MEKGNCIHRGNAKQNLSWLLNSRSRSTKHNVNVKKLCRPSLQTHNSAYFIAWNVTQSQKAACGLELYVANGDDSVCNADETASYHSNLWFASNGSRQRLCIASASANQLSGGQKSACESNGPNVQLIILLHIYCGSTSVWTTVDLRNEILHKKYVCFNQFVHQFIISYIPQISTTLH